MAEKRPDRTMGPGHDTFWAGCAEGELRIQRCAACGRHTWPVARACEHCGSAELAFEPMSGRATLVSHCTFERAYYKNVLPTPWETVLVELEDGPLFISNPVGLTWKELEIGMPMSLTFIDCEDSHGPFRLPVFERTAS